MFIQEAWLKLKRLRKMARWGRERCSPQAYHKDLHPSFYLEELQLAAYQGLCRVAQGKKRPKTCPYPAAKSKAQVYWARARLNEIHKRGCGTHEEIEKLIALATTPLRGLPDKAGYSDADKLYRRQANGHYTRK